MILSSTREMKYNSEITISTIIHPWYSFLERVRENHRPLDQMRGHRDGYADM
jgi:hypothetical protein